MIGFKYKICAISGAVFIAILSLVPGRSLPDAPFELADSLVHVIMYLTWMICVIWEGTKQNPDAFRRYYHLKLILKMAMFGGTMEIIQEKMIPGRIGDISDFMANTVGCLSGVWLYKPAFCLAGLLNITDNQRKT